MQQCVEQRVGISVKRPKVKMPSWSEGNAVCENQARESLCFRENANHSPNKFSLITLNRPVDQLVKLTIFSALSDSQERTIQACEYSIPIEEPKLFDFWSVPGDRSPNFGISSQDALHDSLEVRTFHINARRSSGLAVVMKKFLFHKSQFRQAVHGCVVFISENRGKR